MCDILSVEAFKGKAMRLWTCAGQTAWIVSSLSSVVIECLGSQEIRASSCHPLTVSIHIHIHVHTELHKAC